MTTNLANCVRTSLRESEAISPPKGVSVYRPQMVGANLTYDGELIVLTTGSIHAVDRNFQGKPDTILFGGDEYVSNSMSIDEKGGIYVASDSQMHRIDGVPEAERLFPS